MIVLLLTLICFGLCYIGLQLVRANTSLSLIAQAQVKISEQPNKTVPRHQEVNTTKIKTPQIDTKTPKNGIEKQIKKLQLEMDWSCDDFYCKEGDLEIFPLSVTALAALASNAISMSVTKTPSSMDHPLAVVFDPTCPSCKKYYTTTLKPLLDKGYRILLYPTVYDDTPSRRQISAVRDLLCADNYYNYLNTLTSSGSRRNHDELQCSLSHEETAQFVKTTKATLKQFKLDGFTPISFSHKAMWFHNYDLETIKPYIN